MLRRDVLKSLSLLPFAGAMSLLPKKASAAITQANPPRVIHLIGAYSRALRMRQTDILTTHYLEVDSPKAMAGWVAFRDLIGSKNAAPVKINEMFFKARSLRLTSLKLTTSTLFPDFQRWDSVVYEFMEDPFDSDLFLLSGEDGIVSIEAKDWSPLATEKAT